MTNTTPTLSVLEDLAIDLCIDFNLDTTSCVLDEATNEVTMFTLTPTPQRRHPSIPVAPRLFPQVTLEAETPGTIPMVKVAVTTTYHLATAIFTQGTPTSAITAFVGAVIGDEGSK